MAKVETEPKPLKEIVAERLAELERNPFEAARIGGLERSYVNDILIGKKLSVRGDKAQQLATALDLEVADVLPTRSAGRAKRTKAIALVGLVQAGSDAIMFSEGQGPFDYVKAPEWATDTTVAVEVRGDSLGPIFNGWLIFYDDKRDPVTNDLVGELCVVGLADGRVVVKRLMKGQLPRRFNLTSNSEPPIYDVEVAWAAKVKEMRPSGA